MKLAEAIEIQIARKQSAGCRYRNSSGTVKVAWQKSLRILGLGLDIG
jgi:hypothetical protein